MQRRGWRGWRSSRCVEPWLLPDGCRHSLVLAGMASHYLSAREASLPDALPATDSVLAAIGGLAAPAMIVMGVRRAAERG